MKKQITQSLQLFLFTLLFSIQSFALECKSGEEVLPINNEIVLEYKMTTANGTEKRAHVQGPVVQVYLDRNLHDHVSIQIGPEAKDTLEVVHNQVFGALPEVEVGTVLEVCGDYITSNAVNGRYLPSPDGAIIHWTHVSKNKNHDDGFVIINSVVYGHAVEKQIPASNAVALQDIKTVEPFKPECFEKDANGIIKNPNHGQRGKPYQKTYGFLFDGSFVYKIDTATATQARPDPNKTTSLERFFHEKLGVDLEATCGVKALDLLELQQQKPKIPTEQILQFLLFGKGMIF